LNMEIVDFLKKQSGRFVSAEIVKGCYRKEVLSFKLFVYQDKVAKLMIV